MLLLVFGAGASYDALPDYPPGRRLTGDDIAAAARRLPLANELFDVRFADTLLQFPGAAAIAPYLRGLPDGLSFEQRLEELAGEAAGDEERARQMLSVRFYLQLMLSGADAQWQQLAKGVTNYRTLLDEARRLRPGEPVLIATFNYDRMIEWSLRPMGQEFTDMYSYISGRFRLFKLHGSVDWARQVEDYPIDLIDPWPSVYQIIQGGSEVRLSTRFWLQADRPIWNVERVPAAPALAIPLVRKQEFELPQDHLDNLIRDLPNVTEVLFIGWKAADRPFLELLAEARISPRAAAVSRQVPQGAAQSIQDVAGFEVEAVGGGFADFVRSRGIVSFLEGGPAGPRSQQVGS